MVSFNVNRTDSMAGWLWSIEKEKIFMINLNSKIYSPLKNERKCPRLWLLRMAWLGLIQLRWWQNENRKRKKSTKNTHTQSKAHIFTAPFKWDQFSNSVFVFNDENIEILSAITDLNIKTVYDCIYIYLVEMEGGGSTQLNTTHSARLNWYTCQTIKIINIQVNYKKGAFAHSFQQNYRIPSCDLNEHACNWVGCRYFSYCWLAW